MTSPSAGQPNAAAGKAEPIPPMPPGTVGAQMTNCRRWTAALPALVHSVRKRTINKGDIATYASLVHVLSHSSPETASHIAAAAILQLARREA